MDHQRHTKNKTLLIQKCLVISSILKGIEIKDLIIIDVCTNRGATIGRYIDIIQRKDRNQYCVCTHWWERNLEWSQVNVVWEIYESLLCHCE